MFRFTIRELILLTVIVAVLAEWFVDHRYLAAKLSTAQHDIKEAYFRMGMIHNPFE